MSIVWETHKCGFYCTDTCHAFPYLSLDGPETIRQRLIQRAGIPAIKIANIREVPEALDAWQREAETDIWVMAGPSRTQDRAYLVFLTVKHGEQP